MTERFAAREFPAPLTREQGKLILDLEAASSIGRTQGFEASLLEIVHVLLMEVGRLKLVADAPRAETVRSDGCSQHRTGGPFRVAEPGEFVPLPPGEFDAVKCAGCGRPMVPSLLRAQPGDAEKKPRTVDVASGDVTTGAAGASACKHLLTYMDTIGRLMCRSCGRDVEKKP